MSVEVELVLLFISLVLLVVSIMGKVPLWPSVFILILNGLIKLFGK